MELNNFTPITSSDYMALEGHSWEGQTRVVDNHTWQCWKTADGQLVRTQAQNVPDSLLSPDELAASNAAKHKFDVVANGTTYQLTELQWGTVDHLLWATIEGVEPLPRDEVKYELLIKQELAYPNVVVEANGAFYTLTPEQYEDYRERCAEYYQFGIDAGCTDAQFEEQVVHSILGLSLVKCANCGGSVDGRSAHAADRNVCGECYDQYYALNDIYPELENLPDMSNVTVSSGPRPFVELGQSFDVLIPEVPYGDKAKLLTFEYRKSDSGIHEYYDLLLDGKNFDGVFAKQPENIITGLVGQFGYGLRKFMLELPEVLHVPILKRIGKAIYAERKAGEPYQEPTYVLLDERYYPYLKWTSDVHQVVGDQFGEKYFLRLLDAGFTSSRAASAAKFRGSLIGMDAAEREELLDILYLKDVPFQG